VTTPALKLLQIDLTDECPLFCAHCSNSSGPDRDLQFPIGRLRELIREAKNLGLERIVYSGGEPLRYPYLEEALSEAKANNIASIIFTTGISDTKTRLPISVRHWNNLKNAGLTAVRFSVYSAPSHREFHNSVVRAKPIVGDAFGANERAMKDAQSVGLKVELHFIPSGSAVEDLSDLYSWATELGCSTLHLQIPTYQGRNKSRPFLELSPAEETRLRDVAAALKQVPGQMEFYLSRFWASRWGMYANSHCAANPEQLIVCVTGAISPCNACKYASTRAEQENLLTGSSTLTDIWKHSRRLQEVREAYCGKQLPIGCEGVLATTPEIAVFQS
jgi:MoaA/NifB/PqqE/SkfB family radical SAM enzyme